MSLRGQRVPKFCDDDLLIPSEYFTKANGSEDFWIAASRDKPRELGIFHSKHLDDLVKMDQLEASRGPNFQYRRYVPAHLSPMLRSPA